MGIFSRSLRAQVRLTNTFNKRKPSDDFLIYFELFCTEDIQNRVQVLHLNLFACFRKDTSENVPKIYHKLCFQNIAGTNDTLSTFRSSVKITRLLIIY